MEGRLADFVYIATDYVDHDNYEIYGVFTSLDSAIVAVLEINQARWGHKTEDMIAVTHEPDEFGGVAEVGQGGYPMYEVRRFVLDG